MERKQISKWTKPSERLAAKILKLPKSNGREHDSIIHAARLIQDYSEFQADAIYNLLRKPLEALKPLQELWREENSPDEFCLPDTVLFLKWLKNKVTKSMD